MSNRVRIGSCWGPADAAMVRSMLVAHEIPVVIGGEHHAGMLGGLGGQAVGLEIFVAAPDAEQAVALLAEMRTGTTGDEAAADLEAAALAADPGRDALEAANAPPRNSLAQRLELRKRTGAALLLALCITFGTAHLYARATMRSIMLAALEMAGLAGLGPTRIISGAMVFTAIALDAIGGIWIVRSRVRRGLLPVARAYQV